MNFSSLDRAVQWVKLPWRSLSPGSRNVERRRLLLQEMRSDTSRRRRTAILAADKRIDPRLTPAAAPVRWSRNAVNSAHKGGDMRRSISARIVALDASRIWLPS